MQHPIAVMKAAGVASSMRHLVTVTPCLMTMARMEWMQAEGSEFSRKTPAAYCA